MAIEIKVPQVGESITEVQIAGWHKARNEWAARDEPLVTIESDKATVEIPAPVAGPITQILKEKGTATVGEVIGYMEESAKPADASPPPAPPPPASAQSQTAPKTETQAPAAAPVPPAKVPEPQASTASDTTIKEHPRVTPLARRILEEHGLNATEVQATGPGGRVLKEDVLRHVQQAGKNESGQHAPVVSASPAVPAPATPAVRAAPATPSPSQDRIEEVVHMSPMRRTIAQRLVEAQSVAALLTTFNEIDMSAVMALREKHRETFQQRHGSKLGFMSFFVKAAVEALKLVPQVNAEIRGEDIVYRRYYDIGVAVGTGKGLVVPILRNAEHLGFAEIERTIADFAKRAGENKIGLDELKGGTFTISNGGIYGSLLSTPIVNPPQSGILGLHAIQERPVAREGQVVIRPMMYVALTYDHRVVDGREAVTFLKRVKEVVEDPARMLLEV